MVDKFWVFILMLGVAEASIRFIPVERTTEPDHVKMEIVYPRTYEKESVNLYLKLSLLNFPLGVNSPFSRGSEIYNYSYGQSIHVFLDGKTFVPLTRAIDPFVDAGNFREQFYSLHLPKLSKGEHTIRAFVCRSYGESLKEEGTFQVIAFNVGNKNGKKLDLCKPYLMLNEPQNRTYSSCKPILLDFYLQNCQLSQDGYKVRVILDDREEVIVSWQPFYIYGLEKGEHKITLELLGPDGKRVKELFGEEGQVFQII